MAKKRKKEDWQSSPYLYLGIAIASSAIAGLVVAYAAHRLNIEEIRLEKAAEHDPTILG